eukprot:SAG31_NODE_742_length_12424_cov_16.082353_11_plen_152_part_00
MYCYPIRRPSEYRSVNGYPYLSTAGYTGIRVFMPRRGRRLDPPSWELPAAAAARLEFAEGPPCALARAGRGGGAGVPPRATCLLNRRIPSLNLAGDASRRWHSAVALLRYFETFPDILIYFEIFWLPSGASLLKSRWVASSRIAKQGHQNY